MRIRLITVGMKMPAWITEGYHSYTSRLPHDFIVSLHEIPLNKRSKNANIKKLQEKEGQQMLSAIGKNDHVVALEVRGNAWSTEQLVSQLRNWRQTGDNISLLVGGPEGMLPFVSAKAHQSWSLSPLTLPHPMVRLIIAEQIYRAWSIINNHPYHR
ncbi:MAG: 23S rRNA (pseudouridine(1915)-N(3))-methyltransferase RlmH [Endozoicomonadaceae bacterium]|nr:23S rRNA (pseudouridine(1915)-N(3))-methyltransferase RlmH [Endozoicomonadaceae bacterium]